MPKGQYNIEVTGTKNAKSVVYTELAHFNDAAQNIIMPDGELSVQIDRPAAGELAGVLVGGLNSITKEDANVVAGSEVKITLKVEDHTVSDSPQENAMKALATQDATLDFLNLSLVKQVNAGAETDYGSDNTKLLQIVISFDFTGKKDIAIYRYHGSQAQKIIEAANSDGERIDVAADKKSVTLYAKKFSLYAIGYTEDNGNGGNSGNGGGYYPGGGGSVSPRNIITLPTISSGTIIADKKTASKGEKVTITVTPDNGFVVDKVTVTDKNGKDIEVKYANGKYTFVMSATDVKIDVTFKDANDTTGEADSPTEEAKVPTSKEIKANSFDLNAGFKVSTSEKISRLHGARLMEQMDTMYMLHTVVMP